MPECRPSSAVGMVVSYSGHPKRDKEQGFFYLIAEQGTSTVSLFYRYKHFLVPFVIIEHLASAPVVYSHTYTHFPREQSNAPPLTITPPADLQTFFLTLWLEPSSPSLPDSAFAHNPTSHSTLILQIRMYGS